MNKFTIKACPLCGGTHIERALTCVDHYASGEMFHLCRCQDCGFIFTQDFPVEAEIGRYYETPDYISHSDTKKGAMNSVYHWVRNYMLGEMCRSYESPFSLSDAWIFIATSGLKDDYFTRSLQAVNEITPAEIQDLAQRYLCKETLKEVIAGKKLS